MLSNVFLLGHLALLSSAQMITSIPSQSSYPTSTSYGNAYTLAPTSYSYTYTVTTPTTRWSAPTFPAATAGPHGTTADPVCADTMCPTLDHQRCTDSMNVSYGVLCDTRFSGIVIVTSGKHKERAEIEERDELDAREPGVAIEQGIPEAALEKRLFTGTLDNCAGQCDMYANRFCVGFAYENNGYCMTYDVITGTFPEAGGIAAIRLS